MYFVSGDLSSWKVFIYFVVIIKIKEKKTVNKKKNLIINKMKNLYLHLRECAFFSGIPKVRVLCFCLFEKKGENKNY